MKRLLAATVLATLCYVGLATSNAHACPPSAGDLPEGAAVLPGPNQTVTLGTMLKARPYERPHPGPFTLYLPPTGGNKAKATPIPIPGTRSLQTLRRGAVNRDLRPITLPNRPSLRLPPRPNATPIPLP
jgi:hypothetical protein